MATAKGNRSAPSIAVDIPECPVCLDDMSAPIYLCQSGHSLCNKCTRALMPPICPICRQPMTQMRSLQLEQIISKAKTQCPNKSAGCIYVMVASEVDDHLKECIFREMDCPLGAVFGKCSWHGKLKEMLDHFKERHPSHCDVSSDKDIVLTNVSVQNDDRHVFLTTQGKMHFILTMKLDTIQKMAYWTIQHIGSKKSARQHIYEIHITSNLDNRRKIVFTEYCFNDAIKADEVFRLGKCAVLPLDSLVHFIKDKKLSFRFFIKKLPFTKKNDGDDSSSQNGEKSPMNKGFKPGPKPGPKSPGFKGPGFGPKGPKKPFKGQS